MTDNDAETSATRSTQPEPGTNAKDPWTDDLLDRKSISIALTNLVKAQKKPFVISLHGKWGTGKTFFLKRWKKQLEKDKHRAVYFNAWENDFFDDPLVPMIANLDIPNETVRSEIAKNLKVIVYHNIASVVKHKIGVEMPKIDDDILKTYSKQRSSINILHSEVTRMLEEEGPLVYIIDELDRCRPDFAIATLERTKHVLGIPGLVFVYGINRHDMCESLKSLYGAIDVDVYLRRFFDMEFKLPTPNKEVFCKYLVNRYRIREMLRDSVDEEYANEFVRASMRILSTIKTLSLRDIDQCFSAAALAASNMTYDRSGLNPLVLVAIIVSRLINHDLYQQFMDGSHVAGELLTTLEKQAHDSVLSDRYSWLKDIAALFYAICDKSVPRGRKTAIAEMRNIRDEHKEGKELSPTTLLAESTRNDIDGLPDMISNVESYLSPMGSYRKFTLRKHHLHSLLELTAE